MSNNNNIIKVDQFKRWNESEIPSYDNTNASNINESSKFPLQEDINKVIILCQGNLEDFLVDAIVNTTNERLNERVGISGRIFQRAGTEFATECMQTDGCHTGEAVITKGYDLPASYVIHTVGPRFSVKYQTAAENALHGCYRRCLEVLKENGLESIAFPLINTERKGYPKEAAAHIAIRTVRRFLEKFGDGIETIVFCMETEADLKIYEDVLRLYCPRNKEEELWAISKLPEDTGNELGESVIADRQIRITAMPGFQNADDIPVRNNSPLLNTRKKPWGSNNDSIDSAENKSVEPTFNNKPDAFIQPQENPDDIRRKFDQTKSKTELEREEAERRYNYYLNKAREEDLSDMAEYDFIYTSGQDKFGRPIIVLVANRVPAATVDLERILLYIIKVLDPIVSQDYTMVYFHTNIESENRPPMSWLRTVYNIFNRKYKKNMKRLFIVHPSFWIKLVMFFLTPFVSSKVWVKIVQTSRIMDLYGELDAQSFKVPEDILKYDQEVNAGDYALKYDPNATEATNEEATL